MQSPSSNEQIATLYRFCATSLHYPDPSWLTDEYLESLYLLLNTLEAEEQAQSLNQAIGSSKELLEPLQIEHTRLFINGVPHVAAPPYGSVYIDKSLQGLHAERTLKFYLEHGYRLKDDADLPDHIVHQLEFLSLLAENDKGEAESEFLTTLFLPWFRVFRQKVTEESQHPFYPVIVQLIDFLTKEEIEHGI